MLLEGAFPGYSLISLGQALSPAIGAFQLKQEKEVLIFCLLPRYPVTPLPCYPVTPMLKKGVGFLFIIKKWSPFFRRTWRFETRTFSFFG